MDLLESDLLALLWRARHVLAQVFLLEDSFDWILAPRSQANQ